MADNADRAALCHSTKPGGLLAAAATLAARPPTMTAKIAAEVPVARREAAPPHLHDCQAFVK